PLRVTVAPGIGVLSATLTTVPVTVLPCAMAELWIRTIPAIHKKHRKTGFINWIKVKQCFFGDITHQSNVSKIHRNYIPENGDLRISLFLSGRCTFPFQSACWTTAGDSIAR